MDNSEPLMVKFENKPLCRIRRLTKDKNAVSIGTTTFVELNKIESVMLKRLLRSLSRGVDFIDTIGC